MVDRESDERRRFRVGLIVVLAASAVLWAGYELTQPHVDPRHGHPGLDSAYYLAWSDAILEGDHDGRFAGAFYRAPLYPYLISLLRGPFGAGPSIIRWLQLFAGLSAIALLAQVAFRQAGPVAGIVTAALLGAYHPWLFFSARLLAEGWAILTLALACWGILRPGWRWIALTGVALGLAGLARPNLLLVAGLWVFYAVARREYRRAAWLVLAIVVTVVPVTASNLQRSGHLVPISGNGGLTLYHGNGPNAFGVFTPPRGMTADLGQQREEATLVASRRSGRPMDAVEADRYWGRQALRQRLANPGDTIVLGWNRLLLTMGNREISLDEAPALDPNPWRHGAFVPFTLLLALAAAGATSRATRDRAWIWLAIAACAATPIAFYVSSRYRLPLALLLAVPAGAGAVELLARNRAARIAFVVVGLASLAVPWVAEASMPYAVTNREAWTHGQAFLAQASRDRALDAETTEEGEYWLSKAHDSLRRGHRVFDRSPELWYVEGLLASDDGRRDDAEHAWTQAWEGQGPQPWRARAAGALAVLWVEDGNARNAEKLLRQALLLIPLDENLRHNLVVALIAQGRHVQARVEIARSRELGVPVDPQLEAAAGEG